MDKFLRSFIIACLIVIILVLLGWTYVLSILPDQSKSGDNMMMMLGGLAVFLAFIIVAVVRVSVKKGSSELITGIDQLPNEPQVFEREKEIELDPKKEKSRVLFLIVIALSMLGIAGMTVYTFLR